LTITLFNKGELLGFLIELRLNGAIIYQAGSPTMNASLIVHKPAN